MQIIKTILKNLVLLLQYLDIEKAKEDARKIGIVLFGAGFLGVVIGHYNYFESIILKIFGLFVWIFGLLSIEEV